LLFAACGRGRFSSQLEEMSSKGLSRLLVSVSGGYRPRLIQEQLINISLKISIQDLIQDHSIEV